MRDKEFYEADSIWELKSFGIFAFNIYEAAEFVAKVLCLEGRLGKTVPDKAENYDLDNPSLPELLKEEIEEYSQAIISGIEKKTLKSLHVSRDIHDQIDSNETYIDIDDLSSWFSERGIELSGDFYVRYFDDRLDIASAAIDAIVLKEYDVKNKIKKKLETPEQKKIFQLEMKILELKSQNSELIKQPSPSKDLKTRERDTLLKLIIGIAVEQYGFNPKSKRNEATNNIQSDLATCGISMDVDTILKKLREASELLPPQEEV